MTGQTNTTEKEEHRCVHASRALRPEMEFKKQNKKEEEKEKEKKKERKNKNNHSKITIRRPTESGYDPNDKEVRPATETNQPINDTKKEKQQKKE